MNPSLFGVGKTNMKHSLVKELNSFCSQNLYVAIRVLPSQKHQPLADQKNLPSKAPYTVAKPIGLTHYVSCLAVQSLKADFNSQGSAGDTNATSITATNSYVKVNAGRKINISGAVKSTASAGGNVLLLAQTTLKTGAVTGGANANVDIKSQKGGGTTVLNVGTSGTNGTGKVTAGSGGVVFSVYVGLGFGY